MGRIGSARHHRKHSRGPEGQTKARRRRGPKTRDRSSWSGTILLRARAADTYPHQPRQWTGIARNSRRKARDRAVTAAGADGAGRSGAPAGGSHDPERGPGGSRRRPNQPLGGAGPDRDRRIPRKDQRGEDRQETPAGALRGLLTTPRAGHPKPPGSLHPGYPDTGCPARFQPHSLSLQMPSDGIVCR